MELSALLKDYALEAKFFQDIPFNGNPSQN